MWTRKELKQRGLQTFHLNYWKTVLIALIAAMIGGSMGGMAASGSGSNLVAGTSYTAQQNGDGAEVYEDEELPDDAEDISESIPENLPVNVPRAGLILLMVTVFLIVFLAVFAVVLLISAFLLNPLEIGTKKFFIANLHMPAEVKEIAFGYDHCYKNIVKVMFFRDLYRFLWFLLFIIPGIVKSYEYRMIPYLLAEHPDMPLKEAFAQSRALMNGQKWKTFVLDLSFLGWEILSMLTLGLVGTFYVNPYRQMTNAALYEALTYRNAAEESVVWTES